MHVCGGGGDAGTAGAGAGATHHWPILSVAVLLRSSARRHCLGCRIEYNSAEHDGGVGDAEKRFDVMTLFATHDTTAAQLAAFALLLEDGIDVGQGSARTAGALARVWRWRHPASLPASMCARVPSSHTR